MIAGSHFEAADPPPHCTCTRIPTKPQVAVQLPKRYKPHTNSSKAGSVCPLSFQLTDVGYRCAEADPPTSFLGPQPTVMQVGVGGVGFE